MPDELIADTLLELRQQFGAVSCETQTIRGIWTFEAEVFRDDLFAFTLMPTILHAQTGAYCIPAPFTPQTSTATP